MSTRSDRTVLVTGANSGIGLATTLHLAKLGFHAVGSVRSNAKASRLAKVAASAGLSVDTLVMDVTDAERCTTVIEALHPWAVVNNAGYSGVGAIEDITDDEARHQLETMVVAPMRLARLSLPHMRAAGGGRIVNISSIYGRTTTPFSGWYQASKHALEAASDALRIEVARDGIKVVLIEPGGIKTGIWEELDKDVARRAGSNYEAGYERTRSLVKVFKGLMGEPTSVAKAIGKALVASSPRARYLVGPDALAIAAAQPLIPTEVRDRVTRLIAGL
ncbi:MAG TPA: SDR family oxidoreductase [Acidimicrobiales bacterium]|nr:SDR family oxidoreductase [Acidimicrobiales bacterium]